MAYENCLAEIEKAVGRKLSDDELNDLLSELQKRIDRKRLSSSVDNLDDAVLKVADDYAAEIAEAALIERRNAALQLKARLEALDFVRQQFADNPVLGMEAMLVGVNRPKPGARLSAAAEQNQLANYYLGGFHSDLQVNGLWGEFASGAFDRDIARAMWAKNRETPLPFDGPEQAGKIADIVIKWQEVARQDANKAGAWVKKMPGYIVRQSHDHYKISRAGYDQWKAGILPRLDMDRTFGSSDPEKVLPEVYRGLASGVHLKTNDSAPSGFKGPGNLAKRVSVERELHFRSAEDWFDYNQEFGVGTLAEALIRGFEWHAQSTGLMRKLGPNPGANFNTIADEILKGLDETSRATFNNAVRGKLANQLATLDGTTRIPVNRMGARIAAGVRVSENMAKLGASLLAQFGDIPIYASEMRYQGRGFLSGIADAISNLRKGRNRKEMAEIDGMIGVAMDEMRAQIASRFSIGDDAIPGSMSRLQQLFFKLNGMRWWQDSLQAAAQRSMAHRLAMNKGLAFNNLDPDLQRVLGLFGIDDARWNVIRAASSKEADGRVYAVADTILDLPDEAVAPILTAQGRDVTPARATALKREIADQLRSYYVDRGAFAVVEPDQRTRATMLRGTKPGTVEGEMLRFIAQFKSFVFAVTQKAIGREIYGRGATTLGQALRNGNGEMLGLAQLILWSAVFGYGAMSAKDLVKGRTPRDPLSAKTFFAALAQGGGAGIYGDFLFGEVKNRFGGGVLQTIAGPAAGDFQNIFDLYGRLRSGDDVASAAFRTMLTSTPFMNLFYTRVVMDYLILYQIQEALNPGSLRRMEKRIEKENGQTFLIRPSEAVR